MDVHACKFVLPNVLSEQSIRHSMKTAEKLAIKDGLKWIEFLSEIQDKQAKIKRETVDEIFYTESGKRHTWMLPKNDIR